MKPGQAARAAAVAMATAATDKGETFAQSGPSALSSLPPDEKARAQRLAAETLRWANRSDRVLGPYLRNRPYDVVLNTLRLAVWEMLGDGQDAHGVIDSAVENTKAHGQGAARLVNAVLRNVDRARPDWSGLPIPEMPKPLRKRLLAQYGKDRLRAIEAAHAHPPPIDLTLNGASLPEAKVLPTGSTRLRAGGQVTALPGYSEGGFWVQDAAAALPAKILAPRKGERILDMCAAPGGKTMQLASAGADVVALDISEARMARVAENLARVNLGAELVVADALEYQSDKGFDAVLLDAPCSATGTIRRHPELPFVGPLERLEDVVPLQRRMLARASDLLRPGGRLLYCTCSLLAEEGEDQVSHSGLDVVSLSGRHAWIEEAWLTGSGSLRLTPDMWSDRGGMDGFFIALLQKPA